jgi:phosphate transport system permease protein
MRLIDKGFQGVGLVATLSGLLILAFFIGDILRLGLPRLSWEFITGLPSRNPEKAGLYTALIGTIWIVLMAVIFAIPIGIAAGLYLEEYGKNNRFGRLLETNINNLAGIPSIIYGLLGLEIFVQTMRLGHSVLSAGLTLALLIQPIIIVATRQAARGVPKSLREASYALGATRWQTIRFMLLPASAGGILTGIILALSRAIGESAPLLAIGVMAYVPFAPSHPLDEYSALPVQIYNWISRPQKGFAVDAAAGIIILLLVSFALNGLAIYFRNKWQSSIKKN